MEASLSWAISTGLITTTITNISQRITNHVRNANGTVSRVDPATRASGTAASSRIAGTNGAGQGSRFGSANAQAGARAILNRSTGTAAGARLGNTANASRASSGLHEIWTGFRPLRKRGPRTRVHFRGLRLTPGGHSAAPRHRAPLAAAALAAAFVAAASAVVSVAASVAVAGLAAASVAGATAAAGATGRREWDEFRN